MANMRVAIAALMALGAALWLRPVESASDGITHFRVTDQVVLAGVTRLGINLGDQDYYDSGQMLRNLLFRNPGFEGMSYRSIVRCRQGGASRCFDSRPGVVWKAGWWDGASFEVLDGAAAGRRGKVTVSGPEAGGYALTLDAGGKAIGAGDWLAVSKDFPGDPVAGWWPAVSGGAQFKAERADLSPHTQGRQALRIEAAGAGQSAQLKSYFDSTEGFTFLRMRGRFRLSFRAKSLAGSKTLHVRVVRLVPHAAAALDLDVQLTGAWADYHLDFAASDDAATPGPVEASFAVSGASLLLDDVDLEQTGGDAANQTAFRDEVVAALRELHPGVLRLMSSHAGLGATVDNLLAPPLARQRPAYSVWTDTMEDVPIGIPEFLELCREVGAEPWIVAPTAMSAEEARKLGEYLAGAPGTPGGSLRAAAGRREPWTRAFKTIHIELGNETWNGIFQGETIDDEAAYGRRSNVVFAALRAAAGADAAHFDLVVGTQAANPGRNRDLLAAATTANSLAFAPYLMHSVTQWGTDDELYGPLMAQPEQMSREGIVAATAASAGGRQLAVYEVNLHTTEGNAPAAVLDRFTPSAAAGVAVAGHMLRMMRDHGVRDQMVFALSQFRFRRQDGAFVKLWGAVIDMGVTDRRRPQFLAESLANRAIMGNLVRVEVTGADPRRDQPAGNDGVRLSGAHDLDAYAFADGKAHGLILFNYGLHEARRVSLEGAGLGAAGSVNVSRLMSSGPGASNETSAEVTVVEDKLAGRELVLAPCSMTVLRWSE